MTFLLALLKVLVSASPLLACAVCGAGLEDQSNNAFLKGTALLSLMPLGVIGGAVFYIYKRTQATTPAAEETQEPLAPVVDLR
jgi:hypothetical protein